MFFLLINVLILVFSFLNYDIKHKPINIYAVHLIHNHQAEVYSNDIHPGLHLLMQNIK
jgi:hypothetical protein